MDDVIGFSSTFQRFAGSEFSGTAGSMTVAEVNVVRLVCTWFPLGCCQAQV
jgi:hypothetical protein